MSGNTKHSRGIGLEWRPHRPAAYITARLRAGALDDVVPPAPIVITEPEGQEQAERNARHRANTAVHLMCIDAQAQAAAAHRQGEFGGRTPRTGP